MWKPGSEKPSENNFVEILTEILKTDGFLSEARKYYLGQNFRSNSNKYGIVLFKER
jgi:hypothetical protein